MSRKAASSLVLILLIALSSLSIAWAKEPVAGPVAEVGGQPITLAELETFAADELGALDRQRHQLLEQSLDRLIDQKLIEREAEQRKLSLAELVESEITAKLAPVTDQEIDSWYTANQARVRQPKEQVADQIRSYLEHQRSQEAQQELVGTLRGKHAVKIHLEPLRLPIEAAGSPAKGPVSAPVTLVEFSDFQCPACNKMNPTLTRLHEAYGDQLRIVFKQFPLHSIHPDAQKAAEAALCADEQGKFWPMHDELFSNQRALGIDQLKTYAQKLELDLGKFNECLDSERFSEQVQAELDAGQRIGVSGTPTLFINGRPTMLRRDREVFDQLSAMIDQELERASGG